MKRVLLPLSFFIWATFCIGQPINTSGDLNLGFENNPDGGQLPEHWFQWGSGYKISVDPDIKKEGKFSALIEPIGIRSPGTFGCIAMGIPAKYEAREIELRAFMKFSDVTQGPIGLMIRMDGEGGVEGFENMQGRNIQGTQDWTQFSVKIPYAENAKTIFIGAILSGTGKLWVDNIQILLDGKDISEGKPNKPRQFKADLDQEFVNGSGIESIPLTKDKTNDLQLLGQVWGFLKYYHPTVAAGEYNWDYELFRILPQVITSKNTTERNKVLYEWVKRLGIEFPRGNNMVTDSIKLRPDFSWFKESILGAELFSSLNAIKDCERPGTNYYVAMAPGVGNPQFKNEMPFASRSYHDIGIRLLCLYRYWNIINYFFPYKNLIDEDWNDVLKEYIPKILDANDELSYKLTVLSLIGRVHDTHANIWGEENILDNFRGQRYSALEVKFVEEKAVVTGYYDKSLGEKTGIHVGDVISKVDGKTIDEIVKAKIDITPASNYPTKLRDIASHLLRSNQTTIDVSIWNGSEEKTSKIETFGRHEINIYSQFSRRDTCFRKLDPEISYIYPATLRNEFLPEIMTEVNKTKGLIIDFRCYPSDFIVFTLGAYLLPSPKQFVKFSNGSVRMPGLFTYTSPLSVGRTNPEYYKGKVVIIINETTQSSAEYQTMGLRTAPGATVIGSTTAAADGNVSKIVLPGGIKTMISGIGVYYPDSKETQRIGIIPDIEIKPTIKGIREGRDELLEKAISIINEK